VAIDIADRLFPKRALQSAGTLTSGRIIELLQGRQSKAGVPVNVDGALRISPIWQGVTLLSGDVAKLDFNVWERLQPRGRRIALNHPTYSMLTGSIGSVTSNIWKQSIMANALLYGNGYSRIIFSGVQPVGMEFIPSRFVVPKEMDDGVLYSVRRPPDFVEQRVMDFEMYHLKGLTIDAWGGLSLIDYARDTIGRQIARNDYNDDFFLNHAVPDGWFRHPAEMGDKALERFVKAVERRHSKQGNRHRLGVLEEGMDWVGMGISPEDMLLIEQLKFGRQEVAALLNLPPHKLGDETRAAFNTLEEENKSYHDSSIGVWLCRKESEANDKLFTEKEKRDRRFFTEFNRNQLFRPDFKSRMDGHARVVLAGIRPPNEVRDEEGWNPVPGGDERLIPLNVRPESQMPDARQRGHDTERLKKLLARDVKRMHERLSTYITRWVNKGEFVRALELLTEKHSDVMRDALADYFDDDRTERILTSVKQRWIAAANKSDGGNINEAIDSANAAILNDIKEICDVS
jgi:HK97 family phage portal protein